MNKQLHKHHHFVAHRPHAPMTDLLLGEFDLEAMWDEWPVEPTDGHSVGMPPRAT